MLIRSGQRLYCRSGKGRVLAEPWGSSNTPLRDGPSSLLGDKTGWHGPGVGTYLSVQGLLCCPHVPKPPGHPKFEPKSPLPSPSPLHPPQPAQLYDATAGASLGRDFQKLYLYMHAQRSGCTGCIYNCAGCNRVGGGAGVPAAAPRLSGHTTHTATGHGERGQGTMRRGWGRWRGRQRGRGGCTPRQAHTQSYLGAMNTCPSDSKLSGSRYSKSATEREGYPAGSGDGGAGGQEGKRRTERERGEGTKKKREKGICCSW